MKHVLLCMSLVAIVATISVTSAQAQFLPVPSLVKYQGTLNLPNGDYSIRFSLWDAPAGGIEKWNQTQVITVTNGNFFTLLTTFPTGTFATDLYLEIKVGANA